MQYALSFTMLILHEKIVQLIIHQLDDKDVNDVHLF